MHPWGDRYPMGDCKGEEEEESERESHAIASTTHALICAQTAGLYEATTVFGFSYSGD